MKTVTLFMAFFIPFIALAKGPDDIVGTWLTENYESKVQVYKVGNEYFGKIIWLKEPLDENGQPKKDKNNPDPSKRNNPAMGLFILQHIKYKDGKWKGTIYGPKRGKEADCTLTLKGNDVLEGSVTYGFLSGSKTWRRVK
jgi:uncharacterized protein (DUF2147 family)